MRHFGSLIAILFSIVSQSAMSAGVFEGFISEAWVNGATDSNVGWVQVQGTIAGTPCSSNQWFAVDLQQPDKKMAHVFALTAHVSGKQVKLGGQGVCQGSYELLQYVVVKQ